jgi:hypothetical protein
VARDNAKPVAPGRLGAVGPERLLSYAYAKTAGIIKFGAVAPYAEIPVVVEAWVKSADKMELVAYVNRTPIAGDIHASRENRDIDIFGCGLHNTVARASKDKHFTIVLKRARTTNYQWLAVTNIPKPPHRFAGTSKPSD